MSESLLRIQTERGEFYDVRTSDGAICRLDLKDFTPSGQWRMTGVVRTGPGWAYGTGFVPLADLLAGLATWDWRYKNGRPRWTVRDFDHGTTRIWGNKAGIVAAWRIGGRS